MAVRMKAVTALLIVLAFSLLCIALAKAVSPIMPRSPGAIEVEQICGFKLPGASLLHSHSSFMMKQLFAEYRIPRGKIKAFLSGLPKSSRIYISKRIELYESDISWWKPNQDGEVVSIIARPPNHFETRMLIILGDQRATIYLYHSS